MLPSVQRTVQQGEGLGGAVRSGGVLCGAVRCAVLSRVIACHTCARDRQCTAVLRCALSGRARPPAHACMRT